MWKAVKVKGCHKLWSLSNWALVLICTVYKITEKPVDRCRSDFHNWRAPWKNWICSTTIILRKSFVKPVIRQKTCNYNGLFGSSTRGRHAGHI